MDKQYVIERVRSDLRNDIYELMTHVGYHALEKELTEMVLNTNRLYSQLRRYSADMKVPFEEKGLKKQLFAYLIYRTMNESLGGFHFDRYKSLSTGPLEVTKMNEIVESFDFDDFLARSESYAFLKDEPDFEPFVESRQFRHLEDGITSAIKKNRVIPGVARAIGKDIVDALHLTENYGYIRVSDDLRNREFDVPEHELKEYVSLKRIPLQVGGESCFVLLKRASRNSPKFRLLTTNFGALIKGS
jgi:hypothetical protein